MFRRGTMEGKVEGGCLGVPHRAKKSFRTDISREQRALGCPGFLLTCCEHLNTFPMPSFLQIFTEHFLLKIKSTSQWLQTDILGSGKCGCWSWNLTMRCNFKVYGPRLGVGRGRIVKEKKKLQSILVSISYSHVGGEWRKWLSGPCSAMQPPGQLVLTG